MTWWRQCKCGHPHPLPLHRIKSFFHRRPGIKKKIVLSLRSAASFNIFNVSDLRNLTLCLQGLEHQPTSKSELNGWNATISVENVGNFRKNRRRMGGHVWTKNFQFDQPDLVFWGEIFRNISSFLCCAYPVMWQRTRPFGAATSRCHFHGAETSASPETRAGKSIKRKGSRCLNNPSLDSAHLSFRQLQQLPFRLVTIAFQTKFFK